jgi:hypothetical protein
MKNASQTLTMMEFVTILMVALVLIFVVTTILRPHPVKIPEANAIQPPPMQHMPYMMRTAFVSNTLQVVQIPIRVISILMLGLMMDRVHMSAAHVMMETPIQF